MAEVVGNEWCCRNENNTIVWVSDRMPTPRLLYALEELFREEENRNSVPARPPHNPLVAISNSKSSFVCQSIYTRLRETRLNSIRVTAIP